MAEIRIPTVLRPETGGQRSVDAQGTTVREALETLVAEFPALRPRIIEQDGDNSAGIPSFLNIFVDGDDVRLLAGLDTAVSASSTILLLPAVAGG